MGYPLKKEQHTTKYTYGDYLTWPDDERWEIINGTPYMCPAPTRIHQKVQMALSNEFYNYLKGKSCEVYAAPLDVRLPKGKEKEEDIDTVVQPDILIVCDKSKLDDKGCKGAPEIAIEILSPHTASHDHIRKLKLYEMHGVKEYWIVHPTDKIVMIYKLQKNGEYGRAETFSSKNKIKVGLFKDLTIDLKNIFSETE